MTRARAIELLKGIQFCCDFDDCTNAWDCDECVDAFNMAIEALEQEPTAEYSSDVISRQAAIDALNTGLWGVEWDKALATAMLKDLPSAHPFTEEQIQTMQELESAQVEKAYELGKADRPTDEEDQLKFYYVESLDDYWVGRRLDNFYYATWHGRFGFIWSHSKYLPWGEHIVDENTLWKEHTYPSEPKEIPFTEWIVGFVKKYFADRPTGHWIYDVEAYPCGNPYGHYDCDQCGESVPYKTNFCPNCGADMRGGEEE